MATKSEKITVDLAGQVAIVTGASRGLGRAIAAALAGCGAKVACVARNPEKLDESVAAINESAGTAIAHRCDVSNRSNVAEVVGKVTEQWGAIHILVNNAGITRDTLLPRMSNEEFDEVIDTNLGGAFGFMRAVSRTMMRARYGRIVNVASVSGLVGNPGQTNYSASKAGLIGLTRSAARELGGRQITVNAVAPGFIETEMTDALGEGIVDEIKKRVPCKRLGKAEEVAGGVLFLASPAASYISGTVLVIDGGLTG